MSQAKLRYAARDQVELHMSSLDAMLPEDHIARELWAYVEILDLSKLIESVKSTRGRAGAPAFDPATLLCLWLYATLDSVGSARRLARLVSESLPYRWIAGGDEINYHTLSDFRTDHEEVLDQLLTASVGILAHEGWLDLENLTVAHDGMRVRANAGRDSMRRRPTLEKALAAAKEHVQMMKYRDDPEPSEANPTRRRAARERAARERVGRLIQAIDVMEKMEAKQRKRTDRKPRKPRVSTTDPHAAMLHMANGGKDPAYNLQFTTDVRTRAITSVMVADMSSDTGMLAPAMEKHAQAHGRLPACVLADAGYFKYADIATLEERSCEVLMPDLYPNTGSESCVNGPKAGWIKRWRERMKTEAAKETYRLRGSTVEWSNACLRRQGLLQLTVRGPTKVRMIGLLHALTHNILRILALRKAEPLATG